MVLEKEKNNVRQGLIGNAAILTASVFIVKLIGYIYKLPLSHILGDEGMGYFNSAYSIFAFFYMLAIGGVPRAVAISVSEVSVKFGMSEAKKILHISLEIFLAIGILFSVLLMSFSGFFSKIIGNSTARLSLFCIAPSLTFVTAAGVLRGYLNGIGKVSCVAVAEILDGVSKFVTGLTLAIFASRRNFSAPIISAYTVLGVSIGAFIGALFMFVCSKIPNTNENIGQKSNDTISKIEITKKIFKIAIPITASSAIMGAMGIIDVAMIMKRLVSIGVSEGEAVALYGNFTTLVVPLLNLVSAFISPLAISAMPQIARSCAIGKNAEYYELIKQIISLTAFLIFPVFFAYSFFAEEILMLLFNDESAAKAVSLLVAAAPSVLFSAFLLMLNTVLESSGYARSPLISMSIGAVAKILSAYILIGRFGIFGASFSTSICYAVAFFGSLVIAKRRLKLGVSFFGVVIVPFLISFALFSIGKSVYASIFAKSGNYLIFIGFAAALGIFYLALSLNFMRKRMNYFTEYVKIAKKHQGVL